MVTVPFVAPGQDVGVEVNDPMSPGPAPTIEPTVPVQPKLSVTVTRWAPEATLLRVRGLAPLCAVPPSIE